MMQRVTGEKPKMWGPSIVGFGDHHYKYETGREGDWFKIGFSPRKQNLTVYVRATSRRTIPCSPSLGNSRTGKACLYIKRLEDVDAGILEKVVKRAHDNVG